MWNIHWSTRRLAFRVVLFTCRMCRILLLSSKIRKILSTLQLHSGMDCCLPTYVVISLLSSVYRLFCTSPGALHYVASLTCFSPANYLLVTCFMPVNCLLSAIIRVHFFRCYFAVNHTTGRDYYPARRVLDCLPCGMCRGVFQTGTCPL